MTTRSYALKYSRSAKRRASVARSRVGTACPQCGEREDIQDNGAKGDERTFRCEVCDEQWDVFLGRED